MKKIFLLSTVLLLFMACQPSENQTVTETTSISETLVSTPETRKTPTFKPDQEIEYPAASQNEEMAALPKTQGLPSPSPDVKNNLEQSSQLELIPELAAKPQSFKVDVKKGATLRGAKGTLIQIPPFAFTDEEGKAVVGVVDFRLTESMSAVELIAGGLSTRADDQLLYSGGVLKLEAWANGKKLELAPDSEILLEFPEVEKQADMKLWLAERDADGYLNWKEEAQDEGNMILIPLEALALDKAARDFTKDSLLLKARKEKGVWKKSENDRLVEKLAAPESQQSWLATREFKQRLVTLRSYAYEYELLDNYFNNPNKDLWKADQKVLDDLYFIKRTFPKGNQNKQLDKAILAFKRFVGEKKQRAEILPQFDFDLNREGAYAQLLAEGLSPARARRYLQVYATTQKLEEEERLRSERAEAARERNQSRAATATAAALAYESPKVGKTFRIVRLGTFNNDGPIPILKPLDFEVPVVAEVEKAQRFSRCFLVMRNGRNTFLELKRVNPTDFQAKSVPRNKKAVLLAISYANGQYYMGSQSYRTQKGRTEAIQVKPISMDALASSLRDLKISSY